MQHKVARRVAALYDIHGNLPALEAVLAEVDELGADAIVVGGDVALGPLPRETLERLMSLDERALFVRGNADRALVEEAAAPPREDDAWAARTRWVAEQVADAQREFLATLLPGNAVLEIDGLGPTLFCHASPRSDEEILTRATPESRLREALGAVREAVVVCGHTHVQFDRALAGVRIVNAGSVGMPYEREPGAYWALLGPDVELRRTPYDVAAAAGRMRASGFPEADEFVREFVLSPATPEEATEAFERMATEPARPTG